MTRKQELYYWSLVKQAVARHCELHGIERLSSRDAGELRHLWHAEALGADKSHKDFSNADFDRVKAHLIAIANPDSLGAAIAEESAAETGERARLMYAVNRFPAAYVNRIAWDRFKCSYADELTHDQLRDLVKTLSERRRSKQRARALVPA